MSPVVKAFLADIRQHPGFQEFLKEAEHLAAPYPRFKKGMSAEDFGAETLFASGKQDQHQRWLEFLTGSSSQQEETS